MGGDKLDGMMARYDDRGDVLGERAGRIHIYIYI